MTIKSVLLFSLLLVATRPGYPGDRAGHSLVIVREENNGRMNLLPCRVVLTDGKGVAILPAQLIIKNLAGEPQPDQKKRNYFYQLGGDTASAELAPGSYSIKIYTPISEQGKYLEYHEHEWVSKTFHFAIGNEKSTTLYVYPSVKGSTYSGG